MNTKLNGIQLKAVVLQKLKSYFPAMGISRKSDVPEEGFEGEYRYEIITDSDQILAYLQTLYFEERLIEVQIDNTTQLFFGTLWDLPAILEDVDAEDGNPVIDPDYEEGDYLKELNCVALSPLEPVTGNIRIRSCEKVVLRFYTGTTSVEIGTQFRGVETHTDRQVLLLEFPEIGRIIPNNRPFRARIPTESSLDAVITSSNKNVQDIDCKIVDISAMGMLIEHDNLQEHLSRGDSVKVCIRTENGNTISVKGGIRNFARMRTIDASINLCGLQFDLESRALAGEIEKLYAKVQRIFLRRIARRTDGKDIYLKLS